MATETVDETIHPAAGDLARLGAMLASIARLSEDLEDGSDANTFPLVTALQACAESARRACADAEAALQHAGSTAAAPPPSDKAASDRELLRRAGDALATAQRMGNVIGTLVEKLEDTMAAHGEIEDYNLYLALEVCIDKHQSAVCPVREALDEIVFAENRAAAAKPDVRERDAKTSA